MDKVGDGKEVCLLQNETQRSSQVLLLDLVDVDSVVTDLTVRDVVEAVDEIRDRRLSRAGIAGDEEEPVAEIAGCKVDLPCSGEGIHGLYESSFNESLS